MSLFTLTLENELGGPGSQEGAGPVQTSDSGRAGRQQLRRGVHRDGPHLLPRGSASELRPHLSGGWARAQRRQTAGACVVVARASCRSSLRMSLTRGCCRRFVLVFVRASAAGGVTC